VDYGIYLQQRGQLVFIAGLRPQPHWELFLTSFYQRRHVEDAAGKYGHLGGTFELESLAGVGEVYKQWYNEISIRYDTRDFTKYVSAGSKIEGYLGYSSGYSRLIRSGLDLMFYLPVLQHNRVLIPRIVFDMISIVNQGRPIPFTEYPRQPSFRGISKRTMLRTDLISFVPSLEYQWPLSFNLGGHLFLDMLIVSSAHGGTHLRKAPWALGLGIDFHMIDGELARGQVAAGSEGIRFSLSVGLNPRLGNRSNWE
jgi:hypothetical protein